MKGTGKLTQARLKEVLKYEPGAGSFYWVKRMGNPIVGSLAGYKNKGGYVIIGLYKRYYKAHRLAWLYMEGYFPENEIDHIDRDGSNNRWDNLRVVSHACNMKNSKLFKSNTSKIAGVNYLKKNKKWVARITVSGDRKYLGSFNSKVDAAKARLCAEKQYNFLSCNMVSSSRLYLISKGAK